MPRYDGEFKINTLFHTKTASSQMLALENRIVKTADKISALKDKMNALSNVKIETQEYQEIQNQIRKANTEFDRLLAKQEEMQAAGKMSGSAWDAIQYKLEETGNTIRYANGELDDLVASGKAFTLGSDSEEYRKIAQELGYAENEMNALNQKHNELIGKQNEVGKNGKKNFKKIDSAAKKTSGVIGTLASRFKGIALSLLVFNWITKAFNAFVNGVKDGFKNLVQYSTEYNAKVSELMSANTQLKNSLATAFQPLVETIIPYLVTFVGYMTEAINKVTQLTAALSGKSTWTKAVKVQEDYASSLDGSAKSAKDAEKAVEGYLSPIDDLNKYSSGDKENTGISPQDMFTEEKIDPGTFAWIDDVKKKIAPLIAYGEKLKGVFNKGFFDGLGDYQYRFDMIKDAIESIKDSLIDIWTDKNVASAADDYAQSVSRLLGTLTGAITSIGLSAATNLVSGLSLYLEENKDRIKGYLVSMFDMSTDINDILSEGVSSIAYIFESLTSKQAITLTSNLIGIVSEIIMGVTEVGSKLIRDALNIILLPIIENQEAFKKAFEGLFGVIATVAGTIKDAISSTFDSVNNVYDEHLKPFFESVAQGFSDITGKLLSFLNDTLIPTLQGMAEGLDATWKGHIQPLIDKLVEFVGKVADLITVLWAQYLQPFIEWIIDNILPVVVPVLEAIWETFMDVVGYIADALGGLITILGGVIDFLTGVFSGDWDKAWQGLADIVQGFSDLVVGIIKAFISLIVDVIKAFTTAIKSLVTAFLKVLEGVINVFIGFIKKGIDGLKDFVVNGIKTLMDGAKSAWENGWSAIADFFGGIWDKIVSIIDTAASTISNIINTIINWVSAAIEAIGSLGSAVKGGSFSGGYSVKSVTGYASGTVIPASHGEFLARVGDNNHETEVISPLSTIRQAVRDEMKGLGGGNGGSYRFTAQLNRRNLFDEFIQEAKLQQMTTGTNPFDL